MGNSVTEPGTGFTPQPGVAALRRTPGHAIENGPNPNGVLHPWTPERNSGSSDVEPRCHPAVSGSHLIDLKTCLTSGQTAGYRTK